MACMLLVLFVSGCAKEQMIEREDPNFHYNRGLTYYKEGDYRSAKYHFTQAIMINSDNDEAYFNRGRTNDALKFYSSSISDYRLAIVINPKHVLAHRNLAKAYAKKGFFDKALKTANDALSICTDLKIKKELEDLIAVYNRYKEIIFIYRVEVAYKIQQNWEFPEQLADGSSYFQTMLVFKVMPNGEIKDLFFSGKSGISIFDKSAFQAIMKANPVDPHPKSVSVPYIQMGLRFTPEGME